MIDDQTIPRIRRDIQIVPAQPGNSTSYTVQDAMGLCPDGLLLKEDSLVALAIIGTKRTVVEVQSDLIRLNGGVFVSTDDVRGVIRKFDEMFLLETPRFLQTRRSMMLEYAAVPTRQPVMADNAYPANPAALRTFLDECIKKSPGGWPADAIRNQTVALVCPHIDLNVAAATYGNAYRYWPQTPPERIVLLGTGHSLTQDFFSLTLKDYETPLGALRTDQDMVMRLKSVLGGAVAYTDFAHRNEHSLEMQAIFIRHVLGMHDVPCIPILCGSFSDLVSSVERPRDYIQIAGFLAALREIVEKPGVMTVVSVDLCHIGPKFGHRATSRMLERDAQTNDQKLIQALLRFDAVAFWQEIKRAKDRFNVCGASSLATFLEVGEAMDGRLLEYRMVHESATDSAVGYASLVFKRRELEPTAESQVVVD